jgi:CubicO group peptidase (beta-lactamase class C family)
MTEGSCDSRFAEVRVAFEQNFTERDEVGAAVCVLLDGEPVVDLWGGVADQATGREWVSDTPVVVWSSTKGATALCAHILVDRGLLDLDAPVARYWPEFATAGKETATVRMALSHQAGVPVLRDPLPDGAFTDWDLMVKRVAAEPAFSEPGTRVSYHALTFGWLIGEIVRRVSGRTLGQFFADEVAEPLGLRFWIGLPPKEEPGVARLLPPQLEPGQSPSPVTAAAMADPTSVSALMGNAGGYLANPDDPAYHAAEIPASGGIATARALAGLYWPLAAGGDPLLTPETLAEATLIHGATSIDGTLAATTRFTLGFIKSAGVITPHDMLALGSTAFGHPGAGGSIGFADPEAGISFGYVMNRMGSGIGLNSRGQSLVDATYRSLGYRTRKPGVWIR